MKILYVLIISCWLVTLVYAPNTIASFSGLRVGRLEATLDRNGQTPLQTTLGTCDAGAVELETPRSVWEGRKRSIELKKRNIKGI
ncbi:hypothetical protein EDD17DRAFT_1658340 [Pisolithus thermaeus]|nr:hypothetical protein EDD17DRAFT_1658340 [Pisolithus thermaeus]